MKQKKTTYKNHIPKKQSSEKSFFSGSLKENVLPILALFIFAFILYGNTISHDYALDDEIITRKNIFVQEGFKGIPTVFTKGYLYGFNRANDQSYRPIVLANLAIETGIWGNNPHVNHFFNVLFYALTGILLFLFLKKLLINFPKQIPLLISFLFLAHPIHTEVVANIKSRDELLGFMISLGCLIYLFKYIETNKMSSLLASLGLYLATLLTKENFITMIAIIPLLLYFFTKTPIKKIIYTSLPFAFVFLFYMMLRASILDAVTFNEKMDVINNSLMAAKTLSDQLSTNFFILGKYILLLFFPHPLSYDYSFNQIQIMHLQDFSVIASVLLYVALIVIAVIGIKKKNPIAFGIIFFLISMSVVSNLFIKIGSTLGERFLYTPSLGFCFAIVFLLISFLKTEKKINFKPLNIFMIIVLVLFSFKTISRNEAWKNNFTLFSTDISTSPNSARANTSLAYEYMQLTQSSVNPEQKSEYFNKAIELYNKSISIYPKYVESFYNKGVLFLQMNQNDSAAYCFRKTFTLEPKHANAYNNLGMIFFQKKRNDSAEYYFFKAFKLDSNSAEICGNYALMLHNRNEFKNAEYYYLKSLQLNPAQINVYGNLNILYRQEGDTVKANYYYRLMQNLQQQTSK